MVRPCFIAAAAAFAITAPSAGVTLADESVRFAQRWTPLTGVLSPEGGPQDPGPETGSTNRLDPAAEADQAKRAFASVATGQVALKAELVRVVTDGEPHGALDVTTTPLDGDLADAVGLDDARGALVTDASSGTARAAGLKTGDIIRSVAGQAVAGPKGVLMALRAQQPDDAVTVDVWRAGAGPADLKRLLVARADAGVATASASLGRMLSLGVVFGPRNFAEAAQYYEKAAEAGHLASMTRYALLAKDGLGMPKDSALAATWFRKAADGGQAAAMVQLGTLYEAGRGVKKDAAEASLWYRRAVDEGHAFAMYRLGRLYEEGRGVGKDDGEAVKLFKAAADEGLSEATVWLADKYEQGRGIAKDEDEARKLNEQAAEQVRKAADRGDAVATFNLGILYRLGKGVGQSDTEAASWIVKSLRLGDRYLVAELMRNPNLMTIADRKWLQEVLRDEGAYTGPINGTFSPAVRAAMEALASPA